MTNDFISRAVKEFEKMGAKSMHQPTWVDREEARDFLTRALTEHAKWIEERVVPEEKPFHPVNHLTAEDNFNGTHNACRSAILAAFKEISEIK